MKKLIEYRKTFGILFSGVFIGLMICLIISLFCPHETCSSSWIKPSSWLSNEKISTWLSNEETKIDFFTTEIILTIDITDTNYLNSISGITNYTANYSGSMEPVMFGGDQLIVLNITDKNLIMPGDIIGYTIENRSNPIVHRVIEKTGTDPELIFKTKGDNCTEIDEVKSEDILGVVIGILY